jgi:tetratricopeptide (TPR) repeat protein
MMPTKQPKPKGAAPTILWRGRSYTIENAGILAVQEHARGNFNLVAEIYQAMLVKIPGYVEGHNNCGTALQKLERYDEAIAAYEKAIALKPDYANAHFNRGFLLKKLQRNDEALVSYNKAISFKPDHAGAHNNRGVILQAMHRYQDALDSYDRAIVIQSDNAEAYNNRGTVLVSLGRMLEAEQMFQRARELKPDFIDPLYNLTEIRRYRAADLADERSIRVWLAKPALPPDTREQLLFSLGKICDDCGRYDEAFACYREANELRNRLVGYHPERVTRLTDAIIEIFTPEFVAQRFSSASHSELPLFIVGMPRSGTTLLANILSNHSAVNTAGELPIITDFAADLKQSASTRLPYPHGVKQIAAAAARLIRDYENRLQQAAVPRPASPRNPPPETRCVIDKNPLNFRHIGLIKKLFPRARVIHCTRNPLDTGLSNYFQRFPLSLDYSFDLHHIAHFHLEYIRLMQHWCTLPGLSIIEVSYEDMVTDTETVARKLLDFLRLPWDEHCLTPHTNPHAVDTASKWQVRQPIYTHSIGRWRHYEKYLASLEKMLASAGQITG